MTDVFKNHFIRLNICHKNAFFQMSCNDTVCSLMGYERAAEESTSENAKEV